MAAALLTMLVQLVLVGMSVPHAVVLDVNAALLSALKCDLREDRETQTRLARYGMHTVQYEEGLAVARRVRASRYLGESCPYSSRRSWSELL